MAVKKEITSGADVSLKDFINQKSVLFDLTGEGKKELFELFLKKCVQNKWINSTHVKDVLKALLTREKLGTTGLGGGIAVPHADVKNLKKIVVLLGISGAGLRFESLDGDPVKAILFLLVPEGQSGARLRLISQFCRLVRDPYIFEQLTKATDSKEVVYIVGSES